MDKLQNQQSTSPKNSPKSVQIHSNNAVKHKAHLSLRMLQYYFRSVGQVLPSMAGALAYKLWFATRRFPTPRREIKWKESARTYTLPHQYGPLMLYAWGEDKPNAPTIVLLHGWNGRATQMGAFVEELLQAGFQVTAFDAPGHGLSPGNSTNILEVAAALQSVVDSLGTVDAVIAHSFGAMALTHALRHGLKLRKAVCISSPADATMLVEHFCSSLHIPNRTRKNLLARFHRQFGENIWSRISSVENAQHLSIPVLIVHDENDQDVEVSHSKQIADAWPGAQLMITQGLGHRRILRHPPVLKAIKTFVSDSKSDQYS